MNAATYIVIDIKTGETVAKCKTRQAARNKRDRLDTAYGAVRYAVREVASA
jgi:thymidine phosphorylase